MTGERSTGERLAGEWSTGERSTGEWSTGERSTGSGPVPHAGPARRSRTLVRGANLGGGVAGTSRRARGRGAALWAHSGPGGAVGLVSGRKGAWVGVRAAGAVEGCRGRAGGGRRFLVCVYTRGTYRPIVISLMSQTGRGVTDMKRHTQKSFCAAAHTQKTRGHLLPKQQYICENVCP